MVSLKKYKILNILVVVSSYPRLQILHVYGPMPDLNMSYYPAGYPMIGWVDFCFVMSTGYLRFAKKSFSFFNSLVVFIRRDRIIFAEVIDLKNL